MSDETETWIEVEPRSFEFDGDFRWDRVPVEGWQNGFVRKAERHVSKSGNASVKLSIGFPGEFPPADPNATNATGEPLGAGGVIVDTYVPPTGKRFKALIAALLPELLQGGKFLASHLVGRWGFFLVSKTWNESFQKDDWGIGTKDDPGILPVRETADAQDEPGANDL